MLLCNKCAMAEGFEVDLGNPSLTSTCEECGDYPADGFFEYEEEQEQEEEF